MQIKHLLNFVMSIFLFTTACEAEMSGTVVDAENGQPIEGAVILIEWTTIKGLPGLSHTESSKIIEMLTDKDGKFTITDTYTQTPHVTVYKKGYVAWNNKFIFPSYKKRTDFKWASGYVFRLERFKPEYRYSNHTLFIHGSINDSLPGSEKKIIKEAIQWEELKAFEERQKAK